VRSDDKKRARLNLISHFLNLIPYQAPKRDKVKLHKKTRLRRRGDHQGPALD
jgi:hypothetical protein